MKSYATPLNLMITANRLAWLAFEANAVMGMRLMGMGGAWNVTKGEDRRMWSEKPLAFQQSAMAATRAAMSGKRPDEIMNAAIAPLDRKVGANRKRLAKRGPYARKG